MLKRNLFFVCITTIVRELGVFVSWTIGTFLSAAAIGEKSDASKLSVDYGVMNYRTGRLDNGLDSRGWYEQD